ncbi:hypothetical protein V2J09_008189 [Rumex salicifolius]
MPGTWLDDISSPSMQSSLKAQTRTAQEKFWACGGESWQHRSLFYMRSNKKALHMEIMLLSFLVTKYSVEIDQ